MTDLEQRMKSAKDRFSKATAEALAGDDAAWRRAEIHAREVRRLQAELRKPKPQGEWAISASIKAENEGRR